MPNYTFSEGFVAEAEFVSFVFGLLSVGQLARGDGRGWPTGVVMIVLSGWVYWKTLLYGSALLQLYYLPTQLIGWYRWAKRGNADLRESKRMLNWSRRLTLFAGWLLASYGVSLFLAAQGGAHPKLDAFITVGSLLGQTLIVWGFVEAWPVYLVVDVVSVALYLWTGLDYYAVMFLVFCGLAAHGWWKWTRESSVERRIVPPQ